MSGFVVLAGLWEPGTSVALFAAPDGVLRADGVPVGRRYADKDGSVGFDGLEPGDRFIAVGFDTYSVPLELPCRALSVLDANEVAQPPIRPTPQKQGTQEAPLPVEVPGERHAILQTGVPDGVPVGVALAA